MINNYIFSNMNTSPHPHHIFTQKSTFQDPDVEHLKFLITKAKLADPILHPNQSREQECRLKIQMLEKNNAELTHRLAQKQQEYFQVVAELRVEKQQRRKEQFLYENKIRTLGKEIEGINRLSTPVKQIQHNSISYQSSPSNKIADSFDFRRTQTPINELLQMSQHFSPTKDEIHRLNSYLIENTTTLKLLLEKHNYLVRIREIGSSNDREQRQLIEKTKRIVNDRKAVQEARARLSITRKYEFQLDSSSSEIQIENNVIIQKEE